MIIFKRCAVILVVKFPSFGNKHERYIKEKDVNIYKYDIHTHFQI